MPCYAVFNVSKNPFVLMPLKYQHAHPEWLVKQLRKDWPDHADDIMAANNQAADLTLRVNTRQWRLCRLFSVITKQDIEATACQYLSVGIRLRNCVMSPVYRYMLKGAFSVQDESAQLAAVLLNPAANSVVLDACAALRAKRLICSECADYQQLLAIDNEEKRVKRMTRKPGHD